MALVALETETCGCNVEPSQPAQMFVILTFPLYMRSTNFYVVSLDASDTSLPLFFNFPFLFFHMSKSNCNFFCLFFCQCLKKSHVWLQRVRQYSRQSAILKTHNMLYLSLSYAYSPVCLPIKMTLWVLVVVRILENTLSLRGSVVLRAVLYRIPFNTNSSVMNLYSEVWLKNIIQAQLYVIWMCTCEIHCYQTLYTAVEKPKGITSALRLALTPPLSSVIRFLWECHFWKALFLQLSPHFSHKFELFCYINY